MLNLENSLKNQIKNQILLFEAPMDVWLKTKAKYEKELPDKEIINLTFQQFEKNKSWFVLPDPLQYSFPQLQFLNFAVEILKEYKTKTETGKPIINWFLEQTKKVKNITWRFVKEDYLPLLKSYVKNISSLKPIGSYRDISDLNSDIQSKQQSIYGDATEEQKDIFFRANGWYIAMPHTTEASCELGSGTTWCTARKDGQNLFLTYAAQGDADIILFYVIHDGSDPKTDPWSKLSVGFMDGEPKFNQGEGNISVNSLNQNLTEEKFSELLGQNTANTFLQKMREKASSISGKHPAKKELEDLVLNFDKFKKKYDSFRDKTAKNNFVENAIELREIDPEVLKFLHTEYRDVPWIQRKISKNKNTPLEVLLNIINNSESNSDKRYALLNPSIPENILEFYSNKDEEVYRITVASNPSVTKNILSKLAKDKILEVRMRVAESVNIDSEIALMLLENGSYEVYWALSKNKKAPPEILEKMYTDVNKKFLESEHGVGDLFQNLIRNPSTPIEIFYKIAESKLGYIRHDIAKHPRTPNDLLQKLTGDPSWMVSDEAKTMLKKRNLLESIISYKFLNKLIHY